MLNISDIDECISKPCEPNGTCENFAGSYSCTCYAGFTGYGNYCTGNPRTIIFYYTIKCVHLFGFIKS